MEHYNSQLDSLITKLKTIAEPWMDVPMLARTHGQPATPTRVGKEFYIWVDRLNKQRELLNQIPMSGKFGGATGQFNAHFIAFPDIPWHKVGDE